MRLPEFQVLELLQNVKAAAPQGSSNQALEPHPSKLFSTVSTNSLWGESVGEGGGSTSNRGAGVLHAGVQTPLAAPCLPLRQEVCGTTLLSREHSLQNNSILLLFGLTWLFLNMEFSTCKVTPFFSRGCYQV